MHIVTSCSTYTKHTRATLCAALSVCASHCTAAAPPHQGQHSLCVLHPAQLQHLPTRGSTLCVCFTLHSCSTSPPGAALSVSASYGRGRRYSGELFPTCVWRWWTRIWIYERDNPKSNQRRHEAWQWGHRPIAPNRTTGDHGRSRTDHGLTMDRPRIPMNIHELI